MEKTLFFLLKRSILIVIVLGLSSCREKFDETFVRVEIINNPPELVGEIDTVTITNGFEVHSLDLSIYIVDVENDPLMLSATSSSESVVEVSTSGAKINLIEGTELGLSTISFKCTDGNEGNEISGEFVVKVTDQVGPTYAYFFDFALPNGATNDDIEWPAGAKVEFSSGSGGVTRVIQNGTSFWDLPGQGDQLLTLTLDVPADISENPIFSLDYADSKNGIIYLEFYDTSGGVISIEPELITDDPDFNTLTIDLSEHTDEFDFTNFSGMMLEKYIDWEDADEVDNGTSWIIDNFIVGPSK